LKSGPSLAPYGTYLAIPGGELFYYDTKTDDATGKPAIVLIHGLGDEADTWRYVFPPLAAAGCRVIALDLPGFGRSIWKGKTSMRGHRDAILRLLTMTGIAGPDHPAILAGSSLGAAVSELAACKRPDLVKALVLIDG
jgi:pimeloyl-ACP methyl ester carboxylesterase